MVIVGGVGLAGFGLAGGLALAEDSDLEARCESPDGRGRCSEDDLSTLRRRTRAADASLAMGAVALTAGIVMMVLGRGSDDEIAVAPAISPTQAGGTMRLRF